MVNGHSEAFKLDALRMALTSSLTRHQAALDLGVGVSRLNKWIKIAQTTIEEDRTVRVRNHQAPMKSHLARRRGNLTADTSTQ